jgi:hypothetical protein
MSPSTLDPDTTLHLDSYPLLYESVVKTPTSGRMKAMLRDDIHAKLLCAKLLKQIPHDSFHGSAHVFH